LRTAAGGSPGARQSDPIACQDGFWAEMFRSLTLYFSL
jgi:hypothetical protein